MAPRAKLIPPSQPRMVGLHFGHRRRWRRRLHRVGLAAVLLAAFSGTAAAWQAHFGSAVGDFSTAYSVALDDERNVIAGGMTDAGDILGYATVVKLAPDGSLLWRTTVDPWGSEITRVFVDPAGDVIAGGVTNGQDETDDGQPSVAKLSATTGAVVWRHTDPASLHTDRQVLVDRDGDVLFEYAAWDETYGSVRICRKLSGQDGTVLWQKDDCSLGALDANGDVFASTCDTLSKLSGADGHELWRAASLDGCSRSFPARVHFAVDASIDTAGGAMLRGA